jgi:hypothetical protein
MSHPLRLRILRLCLHEAMTNKELAEALKTDPASTFYHVRTLVRTGFLAAEQQRRGKRGAREIPYRATGKSWTLDVGSDASVQVAVVDAYRAEMLDAGPDSVMVSTRMGLRLSDDRLTALRRRLDTVVSEFASDDDRDGRPVSLFIGLHHRDPSTAGTPDEDGRT